MTKDEAKIILEKSEDLASFTDEDGLTYYCQVSELYIEYSDCFGFAVYPYSSQKPLDLKYAFTFYVHKETGEIQCADAPMVDKEFEMMTKE
jgi:hypothetical protein